MCEDILRVMNRMILFFVFVSHIAEGEQSKCDKIVTLAAWKDQNTFAKTNLKTLSGTWISESCETRPGPQYVLRAYTFNFDGSYTLLQHHYWDDSCSSPKLTILSYGRIQLRNSIIQPGASDGIMKPVNISVIPHDKKAARELDTLVPMECPGQFWKSWTRNKEHIVYAGNTERKATFNLWSQVYLSNNNHGGGDMNESLIASGHITCLSSLKWTFNEVKLLKVQFRATIPIKGQSTKTMKMELFLGDIHSNKKRREFYTPTSFQVPLLKQTQGENITVDEHHTFKLENSNTIAANLITNRKIPPHLNQKPNLPPYIWGKWISERCEMRPMNVYLLRIFLFNERYRTWSGEHKFYSDPFCTDLRFVVLAEGHFVLLSNKGSKELSRVTDLDLHIEEATLTAKAKSVISELKLQGMCGVGNWEVNAAKDLGPTNGCLYLGILIPSIRFDIVKLEMDYKGSWLLYLGQADTNNNLPSSADERPTAFDLPLVKCGEYTESPQNLNQFLGRRSYSHLSSKATIFSVNKIFMSLMLLRVRR